MALGYNSSAANGNIAIGVGSTAPKITMSTAYLTGDAAPSTYISVGTSDNLRRISNVADGSAAQDVVTVHQLTTAYTDLENTIKGIDTTSLNTYSTTAIDSKVADVKSQIANAKTKYFSYSTSTSTLAANADNTGATATAADAMAIGPNANATNTKTLAIGNNVYATGLRSIAIGTADNPTTDSAGTTTTHNTSYFSRRGKQHRLGYFDNGPVRQLRGHRYPCPDVYHGYHQGFHYGREGGGHRL